VKWNTEAWAKHAVSRGNGWPSWDEARVSLVNERHPHRDWGWVLEFEAEKPPTRKQVTEYLREAGLPGHISVTKPGDAGGGRAGEDRQGGGVSSRWRIETAKDDAECYRWVRDFGTGSPDCTPW
jgi:hypothetical protein